MKHGGKRIRAGRPKGQGKYGTNTKPIRVPEHLIDDVMNFSSNGGYKIPLFSSYVAAGYPAYAEDHVEQMIDMNSFLVRNPKSTFCVRVSGLSMINAGIYEGDILLVDSNISATAGKIIVVAVDNMLTVKRLEFINGKPFLMPDNPDFDPIPINENSEITIWGVVTNILRNV